MYQGTGYDIAAVMPEAIASGLFTSLCTVQQPDNAFGPSGAPSGAYVAVAGMVGIICIDDPTSVARIQSTEMKDLAEVMSLNLRHVLLGGYFPLIVSSMRAVITQADGVTAVIYDILGAEADSQAQMTRLEVRLVTQ